MEHIECFFREIRHKKIGLIGVGVSHTQLIHMLAQKGCDLTVYDKRSVEEIGDAAAGLRELGVRFVTGEDYLERLDVDVLFRTPGMYFLDPRLTELRKSGMVITSEMEIFFQLCPCKTIAVTGSDGKTTTTTLISEMLKEQGRRIHLGGNIGKALLPVIEEIHPEDVAVVELSSFQLLSMRRSPDIAVITNVAPNHLDVHGTMEEYEGAKRNILLHQGAFSRAVLNLDNEITRLYEPLVRGECLWFSLERKPRAGGWLDGDGVLKMRYRGKDIPLFQRDRIRLPGIHNTANYLAAITAVWEMAKLPAIQKVAETFGGVEHRIEFVRELNGVRWYNDSIATSPTRTIAGLDSFDQKLIIIAGGYDKKIPFEPLAPRLVDKVKVLILTGPTAGLIESAVRSCPDFHPEEMSILHAENLEQAVDLACRAARPGDVVSLSPACASFDAFPNFEARGRRFKELVQALR